VTSRVWRHRVTWHHQWRHWSTHTFLWGPCWTRTPKLLSFRDI